MNSPSLSGFTFEQRVPAANVVFRAVDQRTGRRVHLKREERRARAAREATFLRRAGSESSPSLVVYRRDGDARWIGSAWIDGESPGAATPLREGWPTELLRALVRLHRKGIVHGDLKPANIIDRPAAPVAIVDFGYAQWIGEDLPVDESGGTPGFVAPERLTGWPADPRSDLYSLGRVLHACGVLPAEHPLYLRLTAPTPAGRPETAASLVPEFVALFGPGRIPIPRLLDLGWRLETPRLERLARGVGECLGLDEFSARRVAGQLLRYSGGVRPRATRIWERWLPAVCPDPAAGPGEADEGPAREMMRRIARDLVASELAGLSPDARAAAGRLSHCANPMQTLLGSGEEGRGIPVWPSDLEDAGFVVDQAPLDELRAAGILRECPNSGPADAPCEFTSQEQWWQALHLPAIPGATPLHRTAAQRFAGSPTDSGATNSEDRLNRGWHLERQGDSAGAVAEYTAGAREALAIGDSRVGTVAYDQVARILLGRDDPFDGEVAISRRRAPLAGLRELWPDLATVQAYALGLATLGRTGEARHWLRWSYRQHPAAQERVEVLCALSEVALRDGAPHRVRRYIRQARALAPDGPASWSRLHLIEAQEAFALQDLARARESLGRAEACQQAVPLEAQQVISARMLAGALAYREADYHTAHGIWSQALVDTHRLGHRLHEAGLHLNLSATKRLLGDLPGASADLEAAERCARGTGSIKQQWSSISMLGEFALLRQEWSVALRYADLAFALAAEHGMRARGALAATRQARALTRWGDLRRAELRLWEGRRLVQGLPLPDEELEILINQFEVALWYRDRLPSEPDWGRALALAGRLGDRHAQADLAILRALRFLLLSGDPRAALGQLEPPLEHVDLHGWHSLARARLLRGAGRPTEARTALGLAERQFGESLLSSQFEAALCQLERCQLAVLENAPAALVEVRELIQRARAISSRWVEARGLQLLARLRHGTTRDRTLKATRRFPADQREKP